MAWSSGPADYSLAQLTEGLTEEERIYRFRCVEAWSMVIPWNGFELKDLLDKAGVKPEAQYVAFETVVPARRDDRRPAPRAGFPLCRRSAPGRGPAPADDHGHRHLWQTHAQPERRARSGWWCPWKYGFKSIKSIVRMTLTDAEPPTSWNKANPREYGFYSNVNPTKDHPRWSQGSERVIGSGLFARRKPTLMFNGYEDEVASLYEGLDLQKFYLGPQRRHGSCPRSRITAAACCFL